MFKNSDSYFDAMTVDPALRRQGIEGLSRQRNIFFGCATVTSLCALSVFWIPGHSSTAAATIGFTAALHWMIVFKTESDLRLLRAVDRLAASQLSLKV
jgi:hypothetical protein